MKFGATGVKNMWVYCNVKNLDRNTQNLRTLLCYYVSSILE